MATSAQRTIRKTDKYFMGPLREALMVRPLPGKTYPDILLLIVT